MPAADTKRIVLGSGKLYIDTFSGSIPADASIETDAKLLGLISGGATISYTPTYYTAKDDLGLQSKKMITDEKATFKAGIMTWNGNTLKKLCSTATVTETPSATPTTRTVKIGGTSTFADTNYVLRFVHTEGTDVYRLTIVGSNEAGFELAFAKDKETTINTEFVAIPHDATGTLIIYSEPCANAQVGGN